MLKQEAQKNENCYITRKGFQQSTWVRQQKAGYWIPQNVCLVVREDMGKSWWIVGGNGISAVKPWLGAPRLAMSSHFPTLQLKFHPKKVQKIGLLQDHSPASYDQFWSFPCEILRLQTHVIRRKTPLSAHNIDTSIHFHGFSAFRSTCARNSMAFAGFCHKNCPLDHGSIAAQRFFSPSCGRDLFCTAGGWPGGSTSRFMRRPDILENIHDNHW